MAKKAAQPELFSLEGNEMIRKDYREISTNTEYMKKVHLDLIEIRPDQFNARVKPDGMSEEMWEKVLMIPELADGIYASGGPTDPIRGDFHKNGHFYPTAGERRTRALRHLIRTGREVYPNGKDQVSDVLIIVNPNGTTDVDRFRMMLNENDTLPLTPMQRARTYLKLKTKHELSNEQIADMWPKLSRQTVDNYILATELPADVQDKIDSGEIKITNALADYRKSKKPSKDDGQPITTTAQDEKKKKEAQEKAKIQGDEEDFLEEDNTVAGTSSKGGPKEDRSSGAHAIPKDAIYMRQQKEAVFKRFFNRWDVLFDNATKLNVADKPEDEHDEERAAILYDKRFAHALQNIMNEYEITVK